MTRKLGADSSRSGGDNKNTYTSQHHSHHTTSLIHQKIFNKMVKIYRNRDKHMQQGHNDKIDNKKTLGHFLKHITHSINSHHSKTANVEDSIDTEQSLQELTDILKQENTQALAQIFDITEFQYTNSRLNTNILRTKHKHLDQLFQQENTEPNGEILYYEHGAGKFFPQAVNEGGYFNDIVKKELESYYTHREKIQQLFHEEGIKNIILYGPGDGKKDLRLLVAIDQTLRILQGKNIVPIDINASYIDSASALLEQATLSSLVDTKTSGIVDNFVTANILKNAKLQGLLYLFFGGSIGNFSDEDIGNILHNMRSDRVNGSRKILMTVFLAPWKSYTYTDRYGEKQTIQNSDYQSDINHLVIDYSTSAIQQWIMAGFHTSLIPAEHLSKLQFTCEYHENTDDNGGRILLGATVTQDISFTMSGKQYHKKVGDKIRIMQSKRFDPAYLHSVTKKNGGTMNILDENISQHTDEHGDKHMIRTYGGPSPVIIETKKHNPEAKSEEQKQKDKTRKNIIKYSTLALATALGIVRGTSKIKDIQYKKKQEKNIFEATKQGLSNKELSHSYGDITNDSAKVENFTFTKNKYYNFLARRYNLEKLSNTQQEYIKSLLHQWLLNQDNNILCIFNYENRGMGDYGYTYSKVDALLEKFIQDNTFLLGQQDIHLIFQENLIGKEEIIKSTLEQKSDIEVPMFTFNPSGSYANYGISKYDRDGYERLETYTTKTGEMYDIGIIDRGGKKLLVGCPTTEGSLRSKTTSAKLNTLYTNNDERQPTKNELESLKMSTQRGKIVAEDFLVKPYFYSIAEKVVKVCKEEMGISINLTQVISRGSLQIKTGYDFSRLAQDKNPDHIKYFMYTFCDDILWGYNEENAFRGNTITQEKEKYNIMEPINTIYTYMEKHIPTLKNVTGNTRGLLHSDIFKELCFDPIEKNTPENIKAWCDKHMNHIIKQRKFEIWGNSEDAGGILFEHAYHPTNNMNIMLPSGLIGKKIYKYNYNNYHLVFEVVEDNGIVYARLDPVMNERKNIEDYISRIENEYIDLLNKRDIGPWSSSALQRAKRSGLDAIQIANSQTFTKKQIRSDLYQFNYVIGNDVIKQYMLDGINEGVASGTIF